MSYRGRVGTSPRQRPLAVAILAALALVPGCNAGNERWAHGARAEADERWVDAVTAYRLACRERPSLCPMAARRAGQIQVREAFHAMSAGQFGRAQTLLHEAQTSPDPVVARAADTAARDPEYLDGLAWDEAAATTDEAAARALMEEIADRGGAASAMAMEWLNLHVPGVLLAEARRACAGQGEASCADAARDLAARYPGSPEAVDASELAQAEYRRIVPQLREAEELLLARATISERVRVFELCFGGSTESLPGGPLPTCEGSDASANATATLEIISRRWREKVAIIRDPHFTNNLEARYRRAGEACEYDPERWPKPTR